jgi:hypothetical protein
MHTVKYLSINLLALVLVTFAPALPVYGVGEAFQTANTLLAYVLLIVQQLTAIAFGAILLFFFWGLAKFILGGAEDKKVARNMMIWGVVALFIAASIWGIVRLMQDSLGVGQDKTMEIPSAILP